MCIGRPAFDCGGSVTIAFVKSTRTIDVKYDHTPMHKTVAQLVELLAPPIIIPEPDKPPPSAKKASRPPKEPKEPKEPRAPKAPRAPKDPNAPKPPRRKRRAEDGAPEGENSTPKRRRKKKDSAANTDANGNMIPPEMPGALPVGQDSERSLYNNGNGSQQNGYSAYPEGLVGSSAANGNGSRSVSQGASSANGGVHSQSILNLPPGEAARRRDVAIKLLSESDIDPQTLSPEQFNIFANQSPDLQRESLTMLAKYGAERLRIVHPTKDGASSGQSTPQGNSGSAAGLAHPENPTSASPSSPSKPKRSRKKKTDTAAEETQADPGSDSGRARPTRGACQSCRDSKTKCDKTKPSCTQCLAFGTTCHYPLAKSRVSRVSKATLEQEEAEEAEEPEHTVVDVDDEPEDLGSPGFHHDPGPQPHAHALPTADPTPSTYSQPHGLYDHHSSFSFPESVSHDVHSGIAPSSMEYMPSPATDNSLHNYSYPAPVQETPVPIPQPPASTIQPEPQHAVSTRSKSRRSLPSGPATQASASASTHALADHGSSWQSMNQSAVAPPTRTSPRTSRTRKAAQNHSQSSVQAPVQASASQAYDDLRQNSSWPQSTTPIPLPPQATSPYQAAAQTDRAKSRQGNRAQSRTPVQSMSAVRPSQTHTSNKSLTDSSVSGYPPAAGETDSNSTTGYDGYSQYQNTRTDSSSNRVTSYDHYSTNPSSTSLSNSYTSYDTYNPRSANTTSSTALANPVPQTTATSYNNQTTPTAPSTSHWGSGTASSGVSQPRNSQAYNSNTQAASTGRSSPYNLAAPSTTQQTSHALQGFSVRPQPPSAPTTRSASAYQQAQQQGSQRQNYNSYSSQPHGANSATTTQQQQNWYGFTPANSSSSNYNASTPQQHGSSGASTAYPANAGGSGSSHAHPHAHGGGTSNYAQSQNHRSMNLSSHTYSSIDGGEHALYEMLRNNQS